jgi:hypothetical protein
LNFIVLSPAIYPGALSWVNALENWPVRPEKIVSLPLRLQL